MSASDEIIQQYQDRSEYDHGFVTDIDTIEVPKGLSEETIRFISKQKKEPQWMLDWRLNARAARARALDVHPSACRPSNP